MLIDEQEIVRLEKANLKHEVWNKNSGHYLDFGYYIADGVDPSTVGLITTTKMTHGLRPTKNHLIYLPSELKQAIKTLTKPYNIPVKPKHEITVKDEEDGAVHIIRDLDPVGRVLSGRWVNNPKFNIKYNGISIQDTLLADKKGINIIKNLTKQKVFNEEGYEGAGWVEVKSLIVDPETIRKVLDKRFLTVSVEMEPDDMFDSISGLSYLTDAEEIREKKYSIGRIVDGTKALGVPAGLRYVGYSFTTHPADTYAAVTDVQVLNKEQVENATREYIVISDSFKINIEDTFFPEKEIPNHQGDRDMSDPVKEINDQALQTLAQLISKELNISKVPPDYEARITSITSELKLAKEQVSQLESRSKALESEVAHNIVVKAALERELLSLHDTVNNQKNQANKVTEALTEISTTYNLPINDYTELPSALKSLLSKVQDTAPALVNDTILTSDPTIEDTSKTAIILETDEKTEIQDEDPSKETRLRIMESSLTPDQDASTLIKDNFVEKKIRIFYHELAKDDKNKANAWLALQRQSGKVRKSFKVD